MSLKRTTPICINDSKLSNNEELLHNSSSLNAVQVSSHETHSSKISSRDMTPLQLPSPATQSDGINKKMSDLKINY